MLQATPPPPDPIILKLYEPASDPTGLADVLLGTLKLTGVWIVLALLLGALMAYGLFWYRSRSE